MGGADMRRYVSAESLVAEFQHPADLNYVNRDVHFTEAVIAVEIQAAVLVAPQQLISPVEILWGIIKKDAIRRAIRETVARPRVEVFNLTTKTVTVERRYPKIL